MSRKKANKRQRQTAHSLSPTSHQATPVLPQSTPPASLSTTPQPEAAQSPKSLWSKVSAIVPWLALIISICSAFGTIYNATNARRAYDRAAGNLQAEMTYVQFLPGPYDVPEDLVVYSEVTRRKELTLRSVKDFLRLNPRLLLKNVGSDPIDSIRIETQNAFSFIDMVGKSEERQRTPVPWVLDQVSRQDYDLGAKLMPGKTVEINITRGLLAQMIQVQARDKEDCAHYAKMHVRCMAKLVGATAYDDLVTAVSKDGEPMGSYVNLVWYPTGFQDEDCKDMLEKLKPGAYVVP